MYNLWYYGREWTSICPTHSQNRAGKEQREKNQEHSSSINAHGIFFKKKCQRFRVIYASHMYKDRSFTILACKVTWMVMVGTSLHITSKLILLLTNMHFNFCNHWFIKVRHIMLISFICHWFIKVRHSCSSPSSASSFRSKAMKVVFLQTHEVISWEGNLWEWFILSFYRVSCAGVCSNLYFLPPSNGVVWFKLVGALD